MDSRPFSRLPTSRDIDRPDLPSDLAAFYSDYEGVGRGSDPYEFVVKLCALDDVSRIAWKDVHIFGQEELAGWGTFAAVRVGMSAFLDEILYVIEAPCCPRGSILAIGVDVAGPGGTGAHQLVGSLVLAPSFKEWIDHMKSLDWVEYGLVPGGIDDLPTSQRSAVRRYYKRLNPDIAWAL